jgi:hypothetical protein
MSRKMIRTAVVLSSLLAALILAGPAHGAWSASSTFSATDVVLAQATPTPPTDAPTGVTPAPTGTATPPESSPPAGPANPGTGESQQAEQTRLDWTPIVVGAILIVLLIVVLVWRRKRRDTTIV